jgi:hypothetical protein
MSRRNLQILLRVLGGVATAAGTRGVVLGASEVLGGGPVSANVDSEYRFYASWYPIMGVLLLRAARHPDRETVVIRACAAGYFFAGSARLLSIRTRGLPHPFQQFLMALEFAIPVVVVPWQHRVRAQTVDAEPAAVQI